MRLGKSYFLKKKYDIKIAHSLPSVFIDKFFDTIAIFLVIILIPILGIKLSKYLIFLISLLIILVFVGMFVLIFASFKKDLVVKFIYRTFFFIPVKYKEKFFGLVNLFVEGTAIFKNHLSMLPKVVLLTLLAVLFDSLFFISVFWAFNIR